MQRTGATEGDQRIVAWVVALLNRHQTQCTHHVFVDDIVDALRGLLHSETERVADFFDGGLRKLSVKYHIATKFLHFGKIPKNDIGIGHRWLGAAAVVRGRTRVGARRLRTDAQRLSELRHVGDRAATRTDGANIDRRRTNCDVTDRSLTT